ncbi:hypothetical protein [Acinetobacter sp. BSP-28]|uniref:hypothetical protein n=1 Tax=Acinetobacter sp. BSP-28 TaxID=3344661 RepID=UPI00376F6A39
MTQEQAWLQTPTHQILPFITGTHFDYDAENQKYLCVIELTNESTVIMPADDVEEAHGNAIKVIKEIAHKNGWLN